MTPMIVEHPLLQHKISILRNKQTGTKEFRDLVGEIATLLCYEATRDLPLEEVEIETPITMAKTKVLAGRKLALVPILRAGMGMLDGMLTLLPAAKVGFIGLYRDEETLQPVEYFCKLPKDIAERDVLVLDPMLATGGSAIDAITQIKKKDGDLSIAVERTPDILGTIGPKKKGQFLCGFSMETRDMLANSSAKLEKKNLDMVVANNLKVAGAGFGVDTNVVTFITPDGTRELPLMSKDDVADAILDEILKRRK